MLNLIFTERELNFKKARKELEKEGYTVVVSDLSMHNWQNDLN